MGESPKKAEQPTNIYLETKKGGEAAETTTDNKKGEGKENKEKKEKDKKDKKEKKDKKDKEKEKKDDKKEKKSDKSEKKIDKESPKKAEQPTNIYLETKKGGEAAETTTDKKK